MKFLSSEFVDFQGPVDIEVLQIGYSKDLRGKKIILNILMRSLETEKKIAVFYFLMYLAYFSNFSGRLNFFKASMWVKGYF